MIFDIERFCSWISKNLLSKAIQFAKQITEITDEDINLIARKTLLFNEGIAWEKREGNGDFDVPMGYFDVAELCKLVGRTYSYVN